MAFQFLHQLLDLSVETAPIFITSKKIKTQKAHKIMLQQNKKSKKS